MGKQEVANGIKRKWGGGHCETRQSGTRILKMNSQMK